MAILAFCVDCDSTQEVDVHYRCRGCGGSSVMPRPVDLRGIDSRYASVLQSVVNPRERDRQWASVAAAGSN